MGTARHLFTALCFSTLFAAAIQECREVYRSRRPTHTACRPPNKNCTIWNRTVTARERRLILETHDHYRSTVALGNLPGFPPAADMRKLEWDDELASVAQAKAEQCTDPNGDAYHDRMADRFTTRFNRTGQNLAWRGRNFPFKSSDWAGRIKSWFVEYVDYPPVNVSRYMAGPQTMVGHFTQVVWAKTGYVGCGFIEYGNVLSTNLTNMQYYVCNYAVTGNTWNKPVYRAGKTCSACPNGTACVVATGLCSRTIPRKQKGKDGGRDVTTRAPVTGKKEDGGPLPEAYGSTKRTTGGKNEKNRNATSKENRAGNSGAYQLLLALIALLVLLILLFLLFGARRSTEERNKTAS
ncbi:scoloptoxin SSD976-like [Dermacentor andersoni]|uniref:scoloptoxin SSD976-like n=1 Tax=Dermacentor andersoni TaxID=34620 RepID=UPI002155EA59|nr:CRISP/Allergen/PR-1-like [Dermacentor andersoni]